MSAKTLAPVFPALSLASQDSSSPLAKHINTSKSNHLVFVDAAANNIEQLITGLSAARVVVLDGEQNGIEQITNTLEQYIHTPLDNFHIISHGDRGSLQLGNTVLNAESLAAYADELTGWSGAIAPQGDILLYGCNVAAGSAGHTFIQQLSQLTGADIAASNDLTGRGGNWALEVATGSIEAQVILDTIAQDAYQGTLASQGTLATYNGHDYTLTTSAKTWKQAQAEAVAQGGNLVTINHAAEYAWLQQTFGTGRALWMGLNDEQQEGEFVWASGEAVTYTNWAPGEPNDAKGNQDYGRINFGKNDLWDDASSSSKFFGIIEHGEGGNTQPDPAPEPTPNPTIAPAPSGDTFQGHTYVLTNGDLTWEEAQAEAVALGGNLVTVNTAEEHSWLQETFGRSQKLWIGLSDTQQEGEFVWASGEALTYTNWAPGKANGTRNNQDYARMNFGRNRQWSDMSGGNRMQGIIEINAVSGDPSVDPDPTPNPDPTPDPTPNPETDPTTNSFRGNRYQLTSRKNNWQAAQAEAVSLGGNLVTINSEQEYAWLQETFGKQQSFWMGLSDVQQEGTFTWVSGEAVTYTNWKPGEPNNSQGDQDYGRTNFGSKDQWADAAGRHKLFGLIEIGGNNNIPGEVLDSVSGNGPDITPPVIAPSPDDAGGIFSRILPVNYSGYNVNAATIGDWSDTANIQALAAATKKIGGQTLRVPGGDTANFWDWDIGGIITDRNPDTDPYELAEALPVALRYKRNINATLENVKPLLTGADADPIWVVNMLTSDLQTEIDHLLEAKRLGMSVDRIELGNEFYFQIPNYTSKDKTPLDYAIRAKEWALAIRAVPELANSTLAVTGSTSTVRSQRGQTWMAAMTTKTGNDNRSVIDVVDAYTLHPYYKTDTLNISKSDVGNRARAGEIARDGTAKLRDILAAPALNRAALDNEEVWITEHNIVESDSIVIGNSWLHALMLDLNTQEFLKDERTTASIAHVLIGNPQWQGLTGADGFQIDGSLRGQVDKPVIKDPSKAFQPTAIGFALGKTADVFTDGTATLLHNSEASIVWRVQNNADKISAVNADDRQETTELPADQTWQVTTYTADPWSTPDSERDLQVTTQTMSGGSTLTIPGFSKIIAIAM